MRNKMRIEGNIYCTGVYYIEASDGKVLYVGSGREVNDALSRHLHFLKRGLYETTNKAILQREYDKDNLVFKVVVSGIFTDLELSVLEQEHIKLNIKTVCNKQKSVTRSSSNTDESTTIKRHNANVGGKNPMTKYSEQIIAEILWLKINGYKPKQIEEMYKEYQISNKYIYNIGVQKWIHLEPIKPLFIIEGEKAVTLNSVAAFILPKSVSLFS